MMTTFYKRPLPPELTSFSSVEGRKIFQEALSTGTMAGYFALAEQFHTQAEPSFCGLGTLVVVLNALGIDPGPGRIWKGPWRWFSEEHLDCCRPLDEVRRSGLTLPQLACLARCNGTGADVQFAQLSTVEAFREAVREATSTAGEPHLIVAYDRSTLGQTGSGHFSPVGGYHAARDQVLILDVARFKYPPHWVPLELLFRAMLPLDPEVNKSRGYALLRRRSQAVPLWAWDATDLSWRTLTADLRSMRETTGVEALAQGLLRKVPAQLLRQLPHPHNTGDSEQSTALHAAICQEIEHTEIGQLVRSAVPATDAEHTALALLLLALPERYYSHLPPTEVQRLSALRRLDSLPPAVRAQTEHLRTQAAALDDLALCC